MNHSEQNGKQPQEMYANVRSQPARAEEEPALQTQARIRWFARLAVPSLAYAVAYTAFTYENDTGIGIFAWVLATLCYVLYLFLASAVPLKKGSRFYLFIMGFLGLSAVLTANTWLIFCSKCGFFLLLIYFLLVQTQNTERWGFWQTMLAMCRAVFGAVGQCAAPFLEGYSLLQSKRAGEEQRKETNRFILIGILITIPLVWLLGSLLVNADAVFGSMVSYLQFNFAISPRVFGIGVTFLFGLLASYCGMHYVLGVTGGEEKTERQKLPALVAHIFTTAVLVLYTWFCLVQVLYLFGGLGGLPEGMTYAQYARSGFFQLLFVCILNVILVLTVNGWFVLTNYLKRVLLGICLCSYIMTASSAYRMILYIQAYRLTVLRVVVLVALAAIAVLLIGVCRSIFHPAFRILPYCIVVISVSYVLFSVSHAEGFIARYDLVHMTEENEAETLQYLETLSLDAAPAALDQLAVMNEDSYAETLKAAWQTTYKKLLEDQDLRAWNIAVQSAKKALR